ncbi:carbonic anhydrase 7 [Anopheles cruzii]|uniref:carbonic anhydrase 7 n=1 Tax=Anopheles cruzii TaxID=68878 RepID=UPI0022EC977C|nr:carbonic anhydrase 7 [Anopheles cruzii]XP_052861456.1 carbonic anhydrase 7 [Anopheles cruzii]XP_052861457.1 carbonic anhydrase 7 [Anopheles cruzii]XP_052861458.1 carbonic anhydrase 7 [Anopheles cruzii]XP_052861459.1 carbonic anhydrase 7 [Anopheles cruzii]XP_052861460.1 carbonic anhydrase 7 [Anopheles cruzii]XP_052861461.1 carbonic anhydrase 7 [Anopheles cruzii]XP_052861462.1 carbonic anhydrase 7 [Anopheles cruzii]
MSPSPPRRSLGRSRSSSGHRSNHRTTSATTVRGVGGGVMLIASILILSVHYGHAQDFGYDGAKGPSHWGEQYNSCTGKHQSPININSLDVKKVNLPPLVLHGFDIAPKETNLTNNGHTVVVTMNSEVTPTVSGGPLHGTYEYSQLHFHWGDNDTFGSEDMIDNHRFPMELHIVFFKQEYQTARTALNYPDGLTVLAFFYEIAPEDNPMYGEFIELLGNVTGSHLSSRFETPPSLRSLIADDLLHYYTYDGSLTTPPCSEVVTWIDFKEPILLSHAQVQAFRALEDEEGHPLTHNFRPVQPLGDRVVLYNTDELIKEIDLDMPPLEGDDMDTNKIDTPEETSPTSAKTPTNHRKQPRNGASTVGSHWTSLHATVMTLAATIAVRAMT